MLATIIFVSPCGVFAKQIETKITADKITVEAGSILNAEGNVRVQFNDTLIRQKGLIFDQTSGKIKFIELQEFFDGNAIRFSADEALFSSDLSEGIIRTANILLDDAIKIHSEEVSIADGEISTARKISRVTSCETCEGKEPNWYLTASSAKRDIENLNIVYKNVTIRESIPVAYLPYLRMPDPSVDRGEGF